jgi:hypothetical protein
VNPKSIREILSDYLTGSDFNEINESINLEKSWKHIAGKIIHKNTEIISLKKGELIIKTSNPVWRNELSLQKKDLLAKIKKTQPKLIIKEIIFR